MTQDDLEFKILEDYPGLLFYNDGRVFLVKTGKFLKGSTHPAGYKFIKMSCGTPYIHRLIACAFLPNPLQLPCINHKNGDRADNRVSNLEYCTVRYNSQGLNTKRGFGCIRDRGQGKLRYVVRFRKNGEKQVHSAFASRNDAEQYLSEQRAIAQSELRVDM